MVRRLNRLIFEMSRSPLPTPPPAAPSSLFECVWESADPEASLRGFALAALETEQIPFDAIEAICRLRDPQLLVRAWELLDRCSPGPWGWYYRFWVWLSADRRWTWDPAADPDAFAILPHLQDEGLNRLAVAAVEGHLSPPPGWLEQLHAHCRRWAEAHA